MNLSDLWDSLKEVVRPGSSAVYTAPGQSYGPAVARTTRVPIQFSNNPNVPGTGQYFQTPSTALGSVMSHIMQPKIVINPTSEDARSNYGTNMDSVIKHEIAHSVLEPHMNDADYEKLAQTNPYYKQMYTALDKSRLVNPAEVPAYAAEKDMSQYGIPGDLQQLYRNSLVKQLQTSNPKLATQYQQIIGGGQ